MVTVFNKKISPACQYCLYATPLSFGDDVLCKKKGISQKSDKCRHYKYDPLKRQPNKVDIRTDFEIDDFKI